MSHSLCVLKIIVFSSSATMFTKMIYFSGNSQSDVKNAVKTRGGQIGTFSVFRTISEIGLFKMAFKNILEKWSLKPFI